MVKELHIHNELAQLSFLNRFIEETCEDMMLDPKVCMKLKLAIEEAVTNVIMYAYPDKTNQGITVKFKKDQHELTIIIEDQGIYFNPLEKAEPDLSASLQDRPIGGLGIHLIKEMMSDVSYYREGDKNVLIMKKTII